MASLLHCVVPQLVARSGASAVRQRTMATLSSSKTTSANAAVKGATGKASGTAAPATSATTTAAKGPSSTPPPKAEAEPNPLWILWQDHKGNPWAIGTVIVFALCGDAGVSYVLLGRKDKKAEKEAAAVATTAVDSTVATAAA
ncbi:hypothetical protein BGW39_005037 [Mortierella sp. 14UC]|nr:hypothetical protein BGW39_005037 [Mortierella sp. 14UC]